MTGRARRTVMVAMAVLITGCSATPEASPSPTEPSPTADAGTTAGRASPIPEPSPILVLGSFPELSEASLPEATAASLEALLHAAVEQGTFRGITAAVIVPDSGAWSGSAGEDLDGAPLTPDARLIIASVGKTVTAAQVLRLVDEGALGLDDAIADHLPAEVAFFDTNGATIREVLGMRSGLNDPPGYIELVDSGATPVELLESTSTFAPAGSSISYANINYILLGMVIEHTAGRPLWNVLRSGVLSGPGLEGLVYPVRDELAADGWMIESDAASLARWGYALYGGSVVSDPSLHQMTDFRGEWYGLGSVDFSQSTPAIAVGFGIPAIGHGGLEDLNAAMLVAFPETGLVVAVQTHTGALEQVAEVVGALRQATET